MFVAFARQVFQRQGQVNGMDVVLAALPGVGLPPRLVLYQTNGAPVYTQNDRQSHQEAENLRHETVDLRGPAGAP